MVSLEVGKWKFLVSTFQFNGEEAENVDFANESINILNFN